MNRSYLAFFLALLVHLFLILFFWIVLSIFPRQDKDPKEEQKIRISLKELPPAAKKVRQIPSLDPVIPQGKQLQKIIKEKPIHYTKKTSKKIPKLNPRKSQNVKKKIEKKAVYKATLPPPKIPLKKPIAKEVLEETASPLDWLYENKTAQEKPKTKLQRSQATSAGRNIKDLYGATFETLSKAQQEYILDNQEIMRRITQEVLTRQAKVTNLKGLNVKKMNIVEFYLHPNGDMSDFKFLYKSGYFILDEITEVTIEYAYSKYPKAKEKTLIRYNVFYDLRSY